VIVETNKVTGETKLSASSPDEEALVSATSQLGVEFQNRDINTMKIKIDNERIYEIIEVFQFSSERKRMTIIFKDPEGKYVMYIKGADSVIFPKIANKDLNEITFNHLAEFAQEGLRTLLIGKRVLDEEMFLKIREELIESKKISDVEEKTKIIEEIVDKLESEIELLGATALEDKLQSGVPETISELQQAGIKIWVLTGDKIDTAENISHSCSLLHEDTEKFRILDDLDTKEKILSALEEFSKSNSKKKALLIEGKVALAIVLADKELGEKFVHFTITCQTVVCSRVSPKQKADVVDLVKKYTSKETVTLAIGDGGNDVSMIQTATVGVGISGKEGQAAANSADFAIAQFRFLKRLLLIHG
jgi:phospholipid-translocating P-type ATPase (flippase)